MSTTSEKKVLYTIGHSTRTFKEFVAILRSFSIEQVADIRRFPGSRKFPQFSKENLEISLPEKSIKYTHFEALGGRRKSEPNSENTSWRNQSFKGYADYMETKAFREAVGKLSRLAAKRNLAIMCSEAVWWRCHRSMISDHFKSKGWKVMHIMGEEKSREHPYTQPARIIEGELTYKPEKQ
ncbi:Fe-S cluster assembly protein HesB [Christiangramia fulva]|uniref:Fe-S cluster assembly protein HesB n=1 Tax=Christiangramia fulva TaxID=2126553 RepID=A0A2R3Z970_9FLAO|nr:DUF488 domain-containing protein [Christiangramia fulva]AVR46813.1 Fe-S cluster assembly protein HesB [Christiangramia fulva]